MNAAEQHPLSKSRGRGSSHIEAARLEILQRQKEQTAAETEVELSVLGKELKSLNGRMKTVQDKLVSLGSMTFSLEEERRQLAKELATLSFNNHLRPFIEGKLNAVELDLEDIAKQVTRAQNQAEELEVERVALVAKISHLKL